MGKLTKTGLKQIVKECLVEILSEGLTAELGKKQAKKSKSARMRQEEARLAQHRQKFETRVDETVSSITGDSVLQEILRDTANTTLQEQLDDSSLENPGRSAGVDISELFSGATANWEKLAFQNEKP
tara:strand:+ start:118 stop:498 length:381 start_codon:yes stop_codon:yes gene_type:complete